MKKHTFLNIPVKYFFIAKYTFSVLFSIIALLTAKDISYSLIAITELFIIFLTSNQIIHKIKSLGQLYNSVLIFLFNSQMLILFFSSSFVTLTMLDNLSSWEALQGRAIGYGTGILLLLVFSFLPIKYVELQPEKDYQLYKFSLVSVLLLISGLCLNLIFVDIYGSSHSPSRALFELAQEKIEYENLKSETRRESEKMRDQFVNDEVQNFVKKPSNLVDKPNVILIFTEGFSQHIIDDPRNVTPTVREYQKKSISFNNYYNHTFATYRGLSGQLFSSYQLENTSRNYLVSLPQIFQEQGYQTSFINTESENKEFSTFLSHLGFERVINSPLTKNQKISFDKEAYNELFKQMEKQASSNQPFFISMYTFGTHVGMDGMSEKYGDGSDRVLSRFYDMDRQFKTFINKFNESKLSDNTVLVFTTDHATYVDDEYLKAFQISNRKQGNLDKIPLFIYYKNGTPETINADGRNSINLTPTILDFLDYSGKNYFLGTSLFADKNESSIYSTIFSAELVLKNTSSDEISDLSDEELKQIKGKINQYYKVAQSKLE